MLGGDDDLAQVTGLLNKLTSELAINRAELDELCLNADEMIGAKHVELDGLESVESTHHTLLTNAVNEATSQLETALTLLKTYINSTNVETAETQAKQRKEILDWQLKGEEAAAEIAVLEHKEKLIRRNMVNWLDHQVSQTY